MSMSRNLRSATGGGVSDDLPERLASTPITKGSWIFFSAPYSSTSYSIWTRGARFRAMNFWLLAFAMSHLLGARRHQALGAAGALPGWDSASSFPAHRSASRGWKDCRARDP